MLRLLLFLTLTPSLFLHAQKKRKVDKIAFCGVAIQKKENIHSFYQPQYDFLGVSENDTIVDIGAASGWFEGAFSAVSDLKHVHFFLVDIDSSCLNHQKVGNMVNHYALVKGDSITNKFSIVRNTVDSLWLP